MAKFGVKSEKIEWLGKVYLCDKLDDIKHHIEQGRILTARDKLHSLIDEIERHYPSG